MTTETETIIEKGRSERHYWRELWRYRELFQVLAWRDIAVRYKQTVIGVTWGLIRPLATMIGCAETMLSIELLDRRLRSLTES